MPYNTGRIAHDADAHVMETPTWLRDHADPGPAGPDRAPALPGGNELRQTGDPDEQRRDLDGLVRAAPRRARLGGVPPATRPTRSWPARTSPPPGRSSPRTGPGPSICWASPASWSSTPSTTAACATGSTRATSTWPTARPGPTTGPWSSSAPSIPACCPPATCPWPISTGPRPWPTKPWRQGAAALLVASGCPPGHSPSHIGLDPVWARAQEAGHPRRLPRRRAPAISSTRTTSATASRSRPTSMAARRTSGRSTTWGSPGLRPRRWPP